MDLRSCSTKSTRETAGHSAFVKPRHKKPCRGYRLYSWRYASKQLGEVSRIEVPSIRNYAGMQRLRRARSSCKSPSAISYGGC